MLAAQQHSVNIEPPYGSLSIQHIKPLIDNVTTLVWASHAIRWQQEGVTVSETKGGPVYGLAMTVASNSTVFPKPISSAKSKYQIFKPNGHGQRSRFSRVEILTALEI